jgi:hypothetical protein
MEMEMIRCGGFLMDEEKRERNKNNYIILEQRIVKYQM